MWHRGSILVTADSLYWQIKKQNVNASVPSPISAGGSCRLIKLSEHYLIMQFTGIVVVVISRNKKLIRRWDSERELSLRRHCTRTKNTIDSCINSATDRFLQRRFTKFSEITQCNGHYAVQGHSRPIWVSIESSYDFLLVIICPIAIAYSMAQIIKSVCVCQCVRLRALSQSHFFIDFHQNWHRRKYPQKEERVR